MDGDWYLNTKVSTAYVLPIFIDNAVTECVGSLSVCKKVIYKNMNVIQIYMKEILQNIVCEII